MVSLAKDETPIEIDATDEKVAPGIVDEDLKTNLIGWKDNIYNRPHEFYNLVHDFKKMKGGRVSRECPKKIDELFSVVKFWPKSGEFVHANIYGANFGK